MTNVRALVPRARRPWAYLGLVAAGWLLIAGVGRLASGPSPVTAGVFPVESGPPTVQYDGRPYLTNTERLRLPDASMIAIGRTAEGFTVYAERQRTGYGGGGGGGSLEPPVGSVTPGPAYVKATDGRFMPLMPR